MANSNYKAGDWSAICDICSFEYKASELKQQWDGAMVCPKDWNARQPQDFVRAVKDNQSVPWSRPEATDSFTDDATALPIPTFTYG